MSLLLPILQIKFKDTKWIIICIKNILQTKLKKVGYEVGEIDGILGSKTRRSVQEIQRTLNQPADAWPTIELLELL